MIKQIQITLFVIVGLLLLMFSLVLILGEINIMTMTIASNVLQFIIVKSMGVIFLVLSIKSFDGALRLR